MCFNVFFILKNRKLFLKAVVKQTLRSYIHQYISILRIQERKRENKKKKNNKVNTLIRVIKSINQKIYIGL